MGDSMARGENSIYNFLRKEKSIVISEETARSYDPMLAMFKNFETLKEFQNFKHL
jgi:hypothetical protein